MSLAIIAVTAVGTELVTNEFSSRRAARGAERASDAQVAGQQAALDYQIERERIPGAVRDASLTGLAGEYGITVDEEGNYISDNITPLDRARRSPLYGELVRTGEEAVGRSASATGRLRGGSTPAALADVNSRSLLSAYNQQLQGLQGLSGIPQNTNAIAAGFSGIGETQGQGLLAQANIEQQRFQNIGNTLGSASNLAFSGGLV